MNQKLYALLTPLMSKNVQYFFYDFFLSCLFKIFCFVYRDGERAQKVPSLRIMQLCSELLLINFKDFS